MLKYPILSTKLNRPRCFQTYFRRERLQNILEINSNKIATIVTAGAGYGKSTLVSQWLDEQSKKYLWLSCDEEMNKLEVLLSYMVAAFAQNHLLEFTETTALFQSQSKLPAKLLIHTFLSELDQLSEKVVFVFDDFHKIDHADIYELVHTFVSYPPKHIHVVLITRYDPLVNFSKQVLNNGFAEIRMSELNLSMEELRAYAKTVYQLQLTDPQVQKIHQRTEGWLLGVNQMLRSINDLDVLEKDIASAFKNHQFSRYFTQELIEKDDIKNQHTLYACSLFYRFSNDLIRFILKENKISSEYNIIQPLINKNLFIIGLDSHGEWYRFHHQFEDALKRYFQTPKQADIRKRFLKSGGQWFIVNGFYEEGIEALLEADEEEFAVVQLQKIRYKLLNTDQYVRLGHLLSLFSEYHRSHNTELLTIQLIVAENQGKYEFLAQILGKLEEKKSELSVQQLAEVQVMQGLLDFFSGDYENCIQLQKEALSKLATYSQSVITFSNAYLAMALNASDRYEEALQKLSVRLDSFHKSETHNIVRTLTTFAIIYALRSDLTKLIKVNKQVLKLSKQHSFYETLGMAYYFEIHIAYRQGNFVQLDHYYEKSKTIRFAMRPVWYANILVLKVLCYRVLKAEEKLNNALNELREFAEDQNADNIFQLENALLVDLALTHNDLRKAKKIHPTLNYNNYPPIYYYFLPQVTQLKLLLRSSEANDLEQFGKEYAALESYAHQHQHLNLRIKLHLLKAMAVHQQGNKADALSHLKKALKFSEITTDAIVFKEFYSDIHELLEEIDHSCVSTKHFTHILAVCNDEKQKHLKSNKEQNTIRLKERDLRILKLVEEGLTNAEIGSRLFLSPESIKKYMNEIFRTLAVKNRINAVRKAHEIGLI